MRVCKRAAGADGHLQKLRITWFPGRACTRNSSWKTRLHSTLQSKFLYFIQWRDESKTWLRILVFNRGRHLSCDDDFRVKEYRKKTLLASTSTAEPGTPPFHRWGAFSKHRVVFSIYKRCENPPFCWVEQARYNPQDTGLSRTSIMCQWHTWRQETTLIYTLIPASHPKTKSPLSKSIYRQHSHRCTCALIYSFLLLFLTQSSTLVVVLSGLM